MVGGAVGVAVGTLVGMGYIVPLLRGSLQRTPHGVVKRLRSPNSEHHVRLTWMTAMGGAWNPAKPLGLNNPIFARGRGTYRLTEDSDVELTWETRAGGTHTYRGPIPEALGPASPRRRKQRRLLHIIGAVYGVVSIAGFAVGFFVVHGSTGAHLAGGGLGVLIGWVVIWFVVMILNVGHGTGKALTRTNSQTRHRPGPV